MCGVDVDHLDVRMLRALKTLMAVWEYGEHYSKYPLSNFDLFLIVLLTIQHVDISVVL